MPFERKRNDSIGRGPGWFTIGYGHGDVIGNRMHTLRWGSTPTLLAFLVLCSLMSGRMLPLAHQEYLYGCLWLPFQCISLWGMFRWARLLFPRQFQGPLGATACLFLLPPMLVLPWMNGGRAVLQLLFTSLACLLSFKIWLRDGWKIPSLLFLGLTVTAGILTNPWFFLVLPWVLLPLWKAGRRRSGPIIGATVLLALTIVCRHFSIKAVIETSGSLPFPFDPGLLWERTASWEENLVVLVASLLWLLLLFTILYHAGRGFFASAAWRSTCEIRLLAGAGSVLALLCLFFGGTIFSFVLPVAAWLSLLPAFYLVLVLGWVNMADRWRRSRSVPNLPAEQPVIVVYGIALSMLLSLL